MKISLIYIRKVFQVNAWGLKFTTFIHQRIIKKSLSQLSDYHTCNSNQDFTKIRRKLLINTINYARVNCNYYKSILPIAKACDELNINSIPFLTKSIIRENLDDLVSKSFPYNFMIYSKTGGSTGEPLGFWSSWNTEFIHQKFLYEYFGYKKGDKILAMDGTQIENEFVNNNIFWKKKNEGKALPYGGMALSSLYLSKENIKIYFEFITSYKPDFIRGYPAFITDLAKYIIDEDIYINFPIKGIELTSEVAFDHQINTIKKAFKTKIFGQYGHTEASVFGYTIDDSFEYYCSPLYGLTEVVDDFGKHVDINKEGEVVVTGFANFGMPFIRYKTGDRAIYGGENNGIVKLKKILGRTADYVINRLGDKVLLTALVFGQHFQALSKIVKWQITQNIQGIVIINIEKMSTFNSQDENEIRKIFTEMGKVDCIFTYSQEFIKTKAGKTKFMIQNI